MSSSLSMVSFSIRYGFSSADNKQLPSLLVQLLQLLELSMLSMFLIWLCRDRNDTES